MDDRLTKILLIEDDEDDYVMTRDLLAEIEGKRLDLEWVTTYGSGIEAIDSKEHDIYLLDYRLGERTGLELLHEAIEKGCTAPIILLTGQGDQEVDIEAMKAGASDYLVKGEITAPLLERAIRYAIERKRTEEQIRLLAYYDTLTSLPNRVLFKDRLGQTLEHARRYQRLAAVLFLDLDDFKRINDTLGHHVGDLLLKSVSDRLTDCVRKSDTVARRTANEAADTVARLGGDEFIILLTEVNSISDVAQVAQRILNRLSYPYTLEGREVFTTTSIGIAMYPSDGEDIDTLLKHADTAMYHAKYQGKNNHQYYTESMGAVVLERLTSENSLRKALGRGEFLLHYQPQVDMRTGNIIGMEALIRWRRPGTGMILPADFIPLAEETGLIVPMSKWVLHTACTQNKVWQAAGIPPIRMSVNLASQQFEQEDLIKTIRRVLDESGMASHYLELEITESAFMQKSEATMNTLHKLTAMGVRLVLDDFGTGYSSLSQLKHIPLSVIKIDQTFVKEISTNRSDAAVVTAIVTMARGLNLEVVAEGVETEEQLSFLREQGCDAIQGYLLSRPLPVEEATTLLADVKGEALHRMAFVDES